MTDGERIESLLQIVAALLRHVEDMQRGYANVSENLNKLLVLNGHEPVPFDGAMDAAKDIVDKTERLLALLA